MYLGIFILFSGKFIIMNSDWESWLSSNSLLSKAQSSTHNSQLTVSILKSFCLVGFLWASWMVNLAVLCLIIILELLNHIEDLLVLLDHLEDLELLDHIEDLELLDNIEDLELLDHIEDILELLDHLEDLEL